MQIPALGNHILYPAIAVAALIVFALLIKLIKSRRAWPYRKASVMSPIEKKFFWLLKDALPSYHVLSQVQLSRVIRPPKNKHEWKWLNKIIRMSLDYVILDNDLETVAVIELDDKSHLLKERQEADRRKDRALKAANVKMIRFKTNQLPSKKELAALFREL